MQSQTHNTRRKSLTLPGSAGFAEQAHINTCGVGSTVQVSRFPVFALNKACSLKKHVEKYGSHSGVVENRNNNTERR